jgi:hypothetical protein
MTTIELRRAPFLSRGANGIGEEKEAQKNKQQVVNNSLVGGVDDHFGFAPPPSNKPRESVGAWHWPGAYQPRKSNRELTQFIDGLAGPQ